MMTSHIHVLVCENVLYTNTHVPCIYIYMYMHMHVCKEEVCYSPIYNIHASEETSLTLLSVRGYSTHVQCMVRGYGTHVCQSVDLSVSLSVTRDGHFKRP